MTKADSGSTSLSGERACTLTAGAIAGIVGGELRGESATQVSGVAPLERATERDVSFIASARYSPLARDTRAGVILATPELADLASSTASVIVVPQPHEALLAVLPRFYPQSDRDPTIHSTARVARGAKIGDGVSLDEYAVVGAGAELGDSVWIGAHAVIGEGVRIGANTKIYPNVTVYSGSEIGARVQVHAGSVIGSDGFGYVFRNGEHAKIPHVGRCIIGDDVEIGANTTIDRGSIDDTVIGAGTKIDNLVQIGHNVHIGRLCLIMAQVGLAGSAHVEDGCVLAGQVGVGGHLTIGARARIGGQAGVFGDVPAGEQWSGYPARPHRESLRATSALLRLPEVLKRMEQFLDEKIRR